MALAMTACTTQTTLKTVLAVEPAVNPDMHGRPSPIVVRIYVLKSLTAFDSGDFFSVFEKDQETLGAELLDREELQMMPGDEIKLRKDVAPEARYLGVVAAYRDLERSQWRASIAVKPKKTNRIRIQLDAHSVVVTPN